VNFLVKIFGSLQNVNLICSRFENKNKSKEMEMQELKSFCSETPKRMIARKCKVSVRYVDQIINGERTPNKKKGLEVKKALQDIYSSNIL